MQPPRPPAWIEPDVASTVVFLGVVAFVGGCLVAGLARDRKPAVLTVLAVAPPLALWLGITAALAASGVMERDGYGVALLVVPSLVGAVALALSPAGGVLARLPVAALIGFQAFRLPLELLLHHWHQGGIVPVQMTWEGENFDVLTGLLAIPLMVAGLRWELPRLAVWVFQLVGFGLLLNVLRVAFGSAPTPMQAYPDPMLLPFHVPFSWIVSMCVAGALAGHLVIFRWLAMPPSRG